MEKNQEGKLEQQQSISSEHDPGNQKESGTNYLPDMLVEDDELGEADDDELEDIENDEMDGDTSERINYDEPFSGTVRNLAYEFEYDNND